MKKWIILKTFLILVFLFGCGKTQSTSILVLDSITDSDGASQIFSDVDNLTNDNAIATLSALISNPMTYVYKYPQQNIIVDQVDIHFLRSDGKNQEGEDIPYSFSQPVHITVPIGESVQLPLVVIRHNAKREKPLVNLVGPFSQEKNLQLVAFIKIHGVDGYGNRVLPVSGKISVWCSNYTD